MGFVTEREATRATALARSVGGVQKVVMVFDIVSEAELAGMRPANVAAQATTIPSAPIPNGPSPASPAETSPVRN